MTIPTEPFAPGLIRVGIQTTASLQVPTAETTWVSTADRYRGRCETIDGAHIYLEEPVADSRRLVAYPAATWGTHLVDINLGLDRLVRIARIQTEHWLNHRP